MVKLRWIPFYIWLCYTLLFVTNLCLYEKDVYDCSNMCADQGYILEQLGFNVSYVVDYTEHHAYIYISDLHIYWECTSLSPRMKSDNGIIFDSIDDIYESNPYLMSNDFKNSRVILKFRSS